MVFFLSWPDVFLGNCVKTIDFIIFNVLTILLFIVQKLFVMANLLFQGINSWRIQREKSARCKEKYSERPGG